MFFYYSRTYRAAQTAAVIRTVACEKCSSTYSYRLVRRAEGAASAAYGIGGDAAKMRAEKAATKKLKKRLERGVDPVACPDCGWIQEEMIAELRRRKYGWLWIVAAVAGPLLAIVTLLWWMGASHDFTRTLRDDDKLAISIVGGLSVLSIVVPLILRRVLMNMLDPNRNYPQRPDPISGAPKPFKAGEHIETLEDASDPNVPQQPGVLTYARKPPEVESGGWITVQLLNPPLPALCCACMKETSRVQQFRRDALTYLPMRVCKDCAKRARRSLFGWTIGIMALLSGAAYLWTLTWRKVSPEEQVMLCIVGGILGLLIGVLIGKKVGEPVRLGRFDGMLNTLRVKFKNRNYTEVYISEPTAPPPAVGRSPDQYVIPIPRPVS